jgi:hypothetical protein
LAWRFVCAVGNVIGVAVVGALTGALFGTLLEVVLHLINVVGPVPNHLLDSPWTVWGAIGFAVWMTALFISWEVRIWLERRRGDEFD